MSDFSFIPPLNLGNWPFSDVLTGILADHDDPSSVPTPTDFDKVPFFVSPHDWLGVTQFVFYLPMVPLAICLMKRNGMNRHRRTWWPLVPFTLMRLVGGPLLTALEKRQHHDGGFHAGLLASAIILLHVGAVLLVVADLDLTRLVLLDKFGDGLFTRRFTTALRLVLVGAVGLLGAGGGIGSQDADALQHVGQVLTLVGYIIIVIDFVVLTLMQIYCYIRKASILPSGHRVLRGALLASPFIMVRILYGIIETGLFEDPATVWLPVYDDPETSPIILFFFMALVMEYIALIVYLWSGFSIPGNRSLPAKTAEAAAGQL